MKPSRDFSLGVKPPVTSPEAENRHRSAATWVPTKPTRAFTSGEKPPVTSAEAENGHRRAATQAPMKPTRAFSLGEKPPVTSAEAENGHRSVATWVPTKPTRAFSLGEKPPVTSAEAENRHRGAATRAPTKPTRAFGSGGETALRCSDPEPAEKSGPAHPCPSSAFPNSRLRRGSETSAYGHRRQVRNRETASVRSEHHLSTQKRVPRLSLSVPCTNVVFPGATFLIYIVSTQLCYHSKEKQLRIFYNNARVPSSGSSSIIMYESLGLESFE
ncbi:hypothetical protein E5288_WYG014874 [Bos mutus]|uniref:Uncharacterized protein n=1 Tax=Bos mutus TaxID=72004 RepID=A0A6B0SA74_9CETA|nr:hypothetical protein [Bos mutus]